MDIPLVTEEEKAEALAVAAAVELINEARREHDTDLVLGVIARKFGNYQQVAVYEHGEDVVPDQEPQNRRGPA